MKGTQTTAALVMMAFGLALMAYAAISVAIFRLRNRDLKVPKNPSPREHSFLLHYLFRQWWYHWARPIVAFLTRHRFHPNTLTFLSLGFAIVSAFLFAFEQTAFAGFFLLLSGACDSLDGWLARETGQSSARGAFLDSTLDRASEIFVFIGLALCLRETPYLLAVLFATGGAVMVSYARARGASLGQDFNRGFMQRPERIVYLSLGAILDPLARFYLDLGPLKESGGLLGITVLLVAILSVATAVYRVVAIAKRLG